MANSCGRSQDRSRQDLGRKCSAWWDLGLKLSQVLVQKNFGSKKFSDTKYFSIHHFSDPQCLYVLNIFWTQIFLSPAFFIQKNVWTKIFFDLHLLNLNFLDFTYFLVQIFYRLKIFSFPKLSMSWIIPLYRARTNVACINVSGTNVPKTVAMFWTISHTNPSLKFG